jgi:hypothetical protein
MVRTLRQAAAWADKVGLALVFPKPDIVLPALWSQVSEEPGESPAIRDDDGNFVSWTTEMAFIWDAKDELPAQGLVCVGKHLARVASCVAPRLVPLLVAQTEAEEPSVLELAVIEAIRSEGPLTGPELRELTTGSKKDVDKAIFALQRRCVVTNSHLVEQAGPWGAIAHDLVERKWKLPATLPPPEDARRALAEVVLDTAGELTAADLAGVFRWRRKAAAAVLDTIADGYDGPGFRVWTRP